MTLKPTVRFLSLLLLAGCSGESFPPGTGTGGSLGASGGSTSNGSGGASGSTNPGLGGTSPGSGGTVFVSGGTMTMPGAGGMVPPGAGGSIVGAGGFTTAAGGAPTTAGGAGPGAGNGGAKASGGTAAGGSAGKAAGGTVGAGGSPPSGGTGGSVTTPPPPLDCGAEGWAVENHGPPKNRVNYVILGDGYTTTSVGTTLVSHINTMLDRRFKHESGQPYGRYRKFVNICVMKAISSADGIGKGSTAFDGGNGGDRLASVNSSKVNTYINEKVPKSFEIDWKAVVLNQNKWENTGSILMLWSGAHADAAGAALHEGGHGHHQLADEYCGKATGSGCGSNTNGSGSKGTEYQEVNSTGDPATTGNKWNLWIGTTQKGMNTPDMGATGIQGTFSGSRYVDSGQYRPSSNSMMNSLFGMNVNTSFNSVSREQMVFSIWKAVVPIDSTEPPAGAVTNPTSLKVNVIDPEVINVDWTVNGTVTKNGGITFDTSALPVGSHTISAKAYDNATEDLVKLRTSVCPPAVKGNYCHGTSWKRSEQTVTWTVTKQ